MTIIRNKSMEYFVRNKSMDYILNRNSLSINKHSIIMFQKLDHDIIFKAKISTKLKNLASCIIL